MFMICIGATKPIDSRETSPKSSGKRRKASCSRKYKNIMAHAFRPRAPLSIKVVFRGAVHHVVMPDFLLAQIITLYNTKHSFILRNLFFFLFFLFFFCFLFFI